MTTVEFFDQLDARIAKYDLLCHPFYKAWAAGELTREDLRDYARDYYHHVDAFPAYLEELCARLGEGELRSAVMANMADENGMEGFSGQPSVRHSDLWLDFVEGMGADRNMAGHQPVAEVSDLIDFFHETARRRTPAEALTSAGRAREILRPARNVRCQREGVRLFHAARNCRHPSFEDLASPIGQVS